jgi:adenylate cyclase
VRVTAQLVEAASGNHLWAERYDRDLEDIFAVQDEVTRTVVSTVVGRIDAVGHQRASRMSPDSLKAYDLVLRAKPLIYRFTRSDNAEARELLERAIALDPDNAQTHASLSTSHQLDWVSHWVKDGDAALAEALRRAKEAVALDDSDSHSHWALGSAYLFGREYDKARFHLEKAIDLNPNDVEARTVYGMFLGYVGETDEALAEFGRARQVDPHDLNWLPWLQGFAVFTVPRFEEAIALLEPMEDPHNEVRALLAASYAYVGRSDEAALMLESFLRAAEDEMVDFPGRSLAAWMQNWHSLVPYKDEADRDIWYDGLRKAGLKDASEAVETGDAGQIPSLQLPDKPSIAVLPFANMSGDPEQDYLSDGFTAELITELARFPHIAVASRNASFAYKGKAVEASEAARDLGARFILEGSVERHRNRFRITARLVDGTSGQNVWAERFDGDQEDIFALKDEVIQKIAATLGSSFGGTVFRAARRRSGEGHTPDWRAYDYLLEGIRHEQSTTDENIRKAIECYEKALELDPRFARACTALAMNHFWQWWLGWSDRPDESLKRARECAEMAAALDPNDYEPHWALGSLKFHSGAMDEAVAEYARALELNPNDADLLAAWGRRLAHLGRAEEGIETIKKAMRLNPHYPEMYLWYLGAASFIGERYDDAIAALTRMRNPNIDSLAYLAASYSCAGRAEEAEEVARRLERDPAFSYDNWIETQPFKNPADRDRLTAALHELGLDARDPAPAAQDDAAPAARPLPDKPSIAVLPFKNLSGDPEQEYFTDGITEDITTELALKGRSVDVLGLAKELGVTHVVEGSVRRSGDRIRIAAQLAEAETGKQIWSERYDRELEDVFAVQDEVARSIVSTVARRLRIEGEARVQRKHPGSLKAYEYLLQAREPFSLYTPEANATARTLYEKALELDPTYAQALAYLAITHLYDHELSWSAPEAKSLEQGLKLAIRAVDLDESDFETHTALAYAYMHDHQFDRAEFHYDRALALNPNNLAVRAMLLIMRGKPEEAVDLLKKWRRVNPLAPDWDYWLLGIAYYDMGDYEAGVAAFDGMVNRPTEVYGSLAACYAQLGQEKQARTLMAEFHRRARDELANYPGRDREGWRTYWVRGYPYEHPGRLEHRLEGLEKAGLYEGSEPVHSLRAEERGALPLPDKPSIAVLPFKNLSGDPEQEYFTDGITEDITTELALRGRSGGGQGARRRPHRRGECAAFGQPDPHRRPAR